MLKLRGARLVLLAPLLYALTACGSGNGPSASSAPKFKNPVYTYDFPDPYVMRLGKVYYAYATAGNGKNVQELKSRTLMHWTEVGDALPIGARWWDTGPWAPTVTKLYNGTYVMFYAAHSVKDAAQCLGRATSKTPTGPFTDNSTKPYLCQTKLGGTIDPDVFRDDNGKLYLYYKNDGNCCGIPTDLWAQQLSQDGKTLMGTPAKLTANIEAWERDVTEAPSMWKHAGKYYLFFSGSHWDSLSYAVGAASCNGPLGPCKQYPNNPVLEYHFGGCDAEGPGGQTIVKDDKGQDWMVYHAWLGDNVGYGSVGGKRVLWLDPLDWKDGKPAPVGPTCKAIPGPQISG